MTDDPRTAHQLYADGWHRIEECPNALKVGAANTRAETAERERDGFAAVVDELSHDRVRLREENRRLRDALRDALDAADRFDGAPGPGRWISETTYSAARAALAATEDTT